MGLTKIRLGDYIRRSTVNNKNLQYGEDLIVGVNNTGVFTTPKGSTNGVNLKPYKIVETGAFVYNPTRLDLGSIAYRTEGLCIVSHLYMVFYLTDEGKKIIDPQWLFIYFRRQEFQREVTFRNFGSQRPEFNFEDMSDIVIPLPPIDIQQKYVAVYNAMLANQQSYERGLEDLKLTIDATVEKYKGKHTEKISLEQLITECDLRNSDNKFHIVYGVNKDKLFMPTVTSGEDLTKYKVVQKHQFACNLMHVGRDVAIPVALNNMVESFIISPAYLVFEINTEEIIPEFFMIWFSREETDRMAWFMCDSNIRGGMDKRRFYDMTIPAPSKKEQLALVEMYEALRIRKEINEKLKTQIKDLCPILIKGSIEEAQA